jgi:hypothetical protein
VGGQSGAKTAQFTYRSCHDTIRTHILNCSQSCRNRIFGTAVRFQPGQIPAVLCSGRITTRQDKSGSGFWPVLEPNRTEPQVKTRTAGGLPGPVANTSYVQARCQSKESLSGFLKSIPEIRRDLSITSMTENIGDSMSETDGPILNIHISISVTKCPRFYVSHIYNTWLHISAMHYS